MTSKVSSLLGLMLVMWAQPGQTANESKRQLVIGKVTYDIDGKSYPEQGVACRAFITKRNPKTPFRRAIPRTAVGTTQWDCEYKDGEDLKTFGTAEAVAKCPPNSTPFDWTPAKPTCECESGFVAAGAQCSSSAGPATPVPASPVAAPSSSVAPKPLDPDDPCLSPTAAKSPTPPRPDKCRLSARAFDIRQRLIREKKGFSGAFAIAVSEGKLPAKKGEPEGKTVTLVTTNNKYVYARLKAAWNDYKKPGETLDERAPDETVKTPESNYKANRHAEDYAAAWFERNKIKQSPNAVSMGSDPKACPGCTIQYTEHAWIKHDRPHLGVVAARADCCRTCKSSKACGDSCIPKADECKKAVGCACDG